MTKTSPKVLVVGSGGREHALAWRLKKSSHHPTIFCAPGNGGTSQVAQNTPIPDSDIPSLLQFALDQKIDLTVVGPEAPLALGIVDRFLEKGLRIVGPTKRAAMLEASKAFAKQFMKRHKIPTAHFETHTSADSAIRNLESSSQEFPVVIKADGLAAGKGVIICKTREEALSAVRQIMVDRAFGESGSQLVIESFLTGDEISMIALVDGRSLALLAPCQDHKAAFDGDKGPNTGGMGAYSPVPLADGALEQKVLDQVFQPTLAGLSEDGIPFSGFLYAGLMVRDGNPFVLEFNVRLGDPETQPLMLRLHDDLFEILLSAAEGGLRGRAISFHSDHAVCIVGTAPGYPGAYQKHIPLDRLSNFKEADDAVIFQAGTNFVDPHNARSLVSTGGRVLGFCARAVTLKTAQQKAYGLVEQFGFQGMHFRRDIGNKAFNYIKTGHAR